MPFAGTDTVGDYHSEKRSDEESASNLPAESRFLPPAEMTIVKEIRATILEEIREALAGDESTQRGAVHCGSNSGVTISPSRR